MAENVRETVLSIRVDNEKAIAAIVEYSTAIEECKEREKELKKSIAEGNDTTGAQAKELASVTEARKLYNGRLQETRKELQNNLKAQKSELGSIKSLKAELSNLQAEYEALSKAERESADGKALQNKIKGVRAEINSLRDSSHSISVLEQALKKFSKGATASLGVIGVAIGAVVGAFRYLNNILHSSEELSMATSKAFAFLQAGSVKLQRAMQDAGKAVLDLWNNKIKGALDTATGAIAKFFGKEKEYAQWKEEQAELTETIAEQTEEQNRITLEQRRINEQNANSELKIAELRAQAADKVTYSARQRLQFIKEASDEEKRISERNYQLAKREYELAQERAKLAGNSAEENEALSQAYVKMKQSQIAYFNKVREMNAQMAEATAQALANEKALAEQRAQSAFVSVANAKEFLEILRETEAELAQGLAPILEDLKLKETNDALEDRLRGASASIGELKDRVATLRTELETMHQMESESSEQFRNRQLTAEQELNNALFALWRQRQVAASAIGGTFEELSSLLEQFGEDNKAAAKASQILAIGSVAIQQGVATAQAIATATRSSATWVDMLVAVATSVGAITATFVPVLKMVKSAKFSTGGYVSGEGTATSDSIPAMLSNGESVNNARATSMFAPLYSSLNQMGGGVPIVATQTASQVQGEDMLARAFAKGMSEANIRVGVDEITRVQNRVRVVENLGVL